VTWDRPATSALPDMLAGQADRLGSDRAARRHTVTSSPNVSPRCSDLVQETFVEPDRLAPNPFLGKVKRRSMLAQ
jgi:hypothetical protein